MTSPLPRILSLLPSRLEWMVLFDLAMIQSFVDTSVVRRMYGLPDGVMVDDFSHIILTSDGALLCPRSDGPLIKTDSLTPADIPPDATMGDRFETILKMVPLDEAHCLGLGRENNLEPVLLFVRVQGEEGRAQAFFQHEPLTEHYELLKAVGVEYLGGGRRDGWFVAEYVNHIPTHIQGGLISNFRRTHYCNLFSLRHGIIDDDLKERLLEAVDDRLTHGLRQGFSALERMTGRIGVIDQSLTMRPPPPTKETPYGDIIPWGMVRRACTALTDRIDPARLHRVKSRLKDYFLSRSIHGLWPYHSGGLPSSTDSGLVLLGFPDRRSIVVLEKYLVANGGYLPQLSEDMAAVNTRRTDVSVSHWNQADYATTCLIVSLRARAGLEAHEASVNYLKNGFNARGGLFFANPFLTDWAAALALQPYDVPERKKLISDILSGMNEDYSFGAFDVAFSTALAVMALSALGVNEDFLDRARLRLVDFMDPKGLFPEATPFYSSELENNPESFIEKEQHMAVGEFKLRVTLYHDAWRIITTAAAVMALTRNKGEEPTTVDIEKLSAKSPHPRYACVDCLDYIRRFALPPYFKKG